MSGRMVKGTTLVWAYVSTLTVTRDRQPANFHGCLADSRNLNNDAEECFSRTARPYAAGTGTQVGSRAGERKTYWTNASGPLC